MATWKIDPQHSKAEFIVRHIMTVDVRGFFPNVNGTIDFDPADIGSLSVEAVIDASSIWTGVPDRDDHLRSPDFLDAKNHPEIRFRSTQCELTGSNRLKLIGDLSLRGISRPITLDVENFGPVNIPPEEAVCIGFIATTRINRHDFDVNWQWEMKGGGSVAGKYVQITVDVEADLAE